MTTQETTALKDLIKVLHDGVNFYTDVKLALKDSGYEAALQDMIDARQQALARLQPLVFTREGDVESGKTITGNLHKAYADILAMIKQDKSQVYISQLEELEDRTLEEIRQAQEDAQSTDIAAALDQVRQSLRQCHDRMRSLKQALK